MMADLLADPQIDAPETVDTPGLDEDSLSAREFNTINKL
jgi:hypothetical protein